MAAVGLLDGIDSEQAQGVDGQLIEGRLVECGRYGGGGHCLLILIWAYGSRSSKIA
jgi:hypothetical protein